MPTEIAPYLNFAGQASAALELYRDALGAEVQDLMRWGDMPGQDIPAGIGDWIMHSCLNVGGQRLYLCDAPPHRKVQHGNGNWVLLQFDDPAMLDTCFAALAEGGEVTMPVSTTFWNARFGELIDRFGVSWMLNCQLPQEG